MDAAVFSAFCKEAAKIPREVRGNKVARRGSKPIGIAKLLAKENAMNKEAGAMFRDGAEHMTTEEKAMVDRELPWHVRHAPGIGSAATMGALLGGTVNALNTPIAVGRANPMPVGRILGGMALGGAAAGGLAHLVHHTSPGQQGEKLWAKGLVRQAQRARDERDKHAESPFVQHVQGLLEQSEGLGVLLPSSEVKQQLDPTPKREDSRDHTTTLPGPGATSAMIERT